MHGVHGNHGIVALPETVLARGHSLTHKPVANLAPDQHKPFSRNNFTGCLKGHGP